MALSSYYVAGTRLMSVKKRTQNSFVLWLFFIVLLSIFVISSQAFCTSLFCPVSVKKVIDGDTISVSLPDGTEKRVRYLLIDTPELHHPHRREEELGEEALQMNAQLLQMGQILLEFDVEKRDCYQRLLAYIWCTTEEGTFLVNEELVRRGVALPSTIPPNVKYVSRIQNAFRDAREREAGLWRLARHRRFTAKQIWEFLPFLRGHFVSFSATIQDVKETPLRYIFRDERLSLIIYKSEKDLFPLNRIKKGTHIEGVGKVISGNSGSEIILNSPLQLFTLVY